MTDRELLEMAAKAAGYHIDKSPYNGGGRGNTGFDVLGNAVLDWHDGITWNPLTDDGDALRLASRLLIDMQFFADDGGFVQAWCWPISDWLREDDLGDFPAATRRAIVRAAAEIGKGMP